MIGERYAYRLFRVFTTAYFFRHSDAYVSVVNNSRKYFFKASIII